MAGYFLYESILSDTERALVGKWYYTIPHPSTGRPMIVVLDYGQHRASSVRFLDEVSGTELARHTGRWCMRDATIFHDWRGEWGALVPLFEISLNELPHRFYAYEKCDVVSVTDDELIVRRVMPSGRDVFTWKRYRD
jgi:hypothetical protein